MEKMVKLGPKMKGSIWDEGGNTKIVQILISHESYEIRSIQFIYAVDGKVVSSEMHGKPNGSNFDVVTFNHPGEYLVSISGEYTSDSLVSIAFSTNNRKYGPFGKIDDLGSWVSLSKYAYNFTKSSFGGFHGSVGRWGTLSAIGVYIRPLGSLAEIETYKSEYDKSTCFKKG